MEPWRIRQWKIAEEIVAAGLMDDLEEAKQVVLDGIMAYVSDDDEHAEFHYLEPEWKDERTAYRIAERMVMGKEYYAPGYHKRIPEDKKRKINKIKNKILAKCPIIKAK